MPKLAINGLAINYARLGQGPDVVMVHGLMSSLAFWRPAVVGGITPDFCVTLYDLRGHGASSMPPSGYTSADMAADLCALLDGLGIERAHLIGHSFGGVIALHCAALYPERVAKLVLADVRIPAVQAFTDIRDWGLWAAWQSLLQAGEFTVDESRLADPAYVLRLTVQSAPLLEANQDRRARARSLRLLDHTTAVSDFTDPAGLTLDVLAQVPHPTLAIYGRYSPHLQVASYLEKNMRQCKLVIVPGAGHFHPLRRPKDFVANVIEFLRDGGAREPHSHGD